MSEMTGQDFIKRFEAFAPQSLAMEGDPVGLAIGTLNKPVSKVLVTLDVRPEVVAEAIEAEVELIFAHHPPIFRPISTITTDSPQQKMYADLLKHDIAVYGAHTNLDVAEDGMNDWLADKLGLTHTEILSVTKTEPYKKLSVFVPLEAETSVTQALHQAGAGKVGEHKGVSYLTEGQRNFPPTKRSQPATGSIDRPETVKEACIEMIVLESQISDVLAALKRAHPYEEPVYTLVTLNGIGKDYGLGRVGKLDKPVSLKEYVQIVAEKFDVEGLRYITNDPDKLIQRVAILGGDGGNFYSDALKKEADVYITGDVYYHTGHDMLADGLNVIDPGHHIESICKPYLTRLFNDFASKENWDVEIIPSKLNTDPFHFYPSK